MEAPVQIRGIRTWCANSPNFSHQPWASRGQQNRFFAMFLVHMWGRVKPLQGRVYGGGRGEEGRPERKISHTAHTHSHTHTHSSYTLQPVGSGHKPNWRSPRKGGYNREANSGHAFYSSLPGNKGGGERGRGGKRRERKKER